MEHEENKDNDIQIDLSFGLTADRIQALSDCIFAFAMTLLVLGLQLPNIIVQHQLSKVLVKLEPGLATYALSFLALGGLWIAHHNQYYWIKKSNRTFLWINILFLFFIALIPFSTKVLTEYDDQSLAVIIYGMNLVICLGILYFHWSYATNKSKLTENNVSTHIQRLIKVRILFIIIASIIAMATSFFFIKISMLLLLLAQFAVIIPTLTIDRFIVWILRFLGMKTKVKILP